MEVDPPFTPQAPRAIPDPTANTLDPVAYADKIEQSTRDEDSSHRSITDVGRHALTQIRDGRPIRDYWEPSDSIWVDIRPIRETEPALSHPLPAEFGIHLNSIIVFLRDKCRPIIFPSPFVNVATRAIGLYTLVRIADWVCRYLVVFGDSAEHVRPFRNFVGGVRACAESVVMVVCQILNLLGRSEAELVGAGVYHVHIMPALRMLYGHLRCWPDHRLDDSAFRLLDTAMRVAFDLRDVEGYLDGSE